MKASTGNMRNDERKFHMHEKLVLKHWIDNLAQNDIINDCAKSFSLYYKIGFRIIEILEEMEKNMVITTEVDWCQLDYNY